MFSTIQPLKYQKPKQPITQKLSCTYTIRSHEAVETEIAGDAEYPGDYLIRKIGLASSWFYSFSHEPSAGLLHILVCSRPLSCRYSRRPLIYYLLPRYRPERVPLRPRGSSSRQ